MIWRYIQYAIPIVYLGSMAIWAAADVGSTPDCKPYEWHLPFAILCILGTAVLMGFFAGRASADKDG